MTHLIVTVNKLNRRSSPIANVADKSNIIDTVSKGFSFNAVEQLTNAAGTWYKDEQNRYYWGGGLKIDTRVITAENSSTDNINWYLSFTGNAEDRLDGERTRQIGIGKLTIVQEDGKTVASFDVVSGPGTNGLLPNGKYRATSFSMDSNFPDEFGLSYKIHLDPVGSTAIGFNRTALLIHPVQLRYKSQNVYVPSPTDGCVGLIGHTNAEPFMNHIKPYLEKHNSIDLDVDVEGNADVKISLGNKLNYV